MDKLSGESSVNDGNVTPSACLTSAEHQNRTAGDVTVIVATDVTSSAGDSSVCTDVSAVDSSGVTADTEDVIGDSLSDDFQFSFVSKAGVSHF